MVSSEYWFGAEASFYNGVATQSLRFNDNGSAYLYRTPSSASNRRTWTWSAWLKIGNIDLSKVPFSAYSGTTDYFNIQITSSNTLQVMDRVSGSYPYIFNSNQLFRDVTSWYHIVVATDTTQSTESDRVKIYVNGEQITSWSSSTYPSQNHETYVNSTINHILGQRGTLAHYYDGYMAEVNFVDGYQYDPTYFGETKNGVWIAKNYTGSYGTNGFRFEFKQTGVGTGSASTIGADTSGSANHYTSTGIDAYDCNMLDSPENNFCTMNPLDKGSACTLADGNLETQQTADDATTSTFHFDIATSKHYAEFYTITTPGTSTAIGITESEVASTLRDSGSNLAQYWYVGNGQIRNNTYTNYGDSWTSLGHIIGVRIDNGSVYFYKDGTIQNSGNPAFTGLTGFFTITVGEQSQTNGRIMANFGQDSSFAGNKTSGSANAQDDNGNGDFYYSVPSGHLALCSANISDDDLPISPNADTQADDHFNTVLYTGNGSTQSITGVGFQPDWVWFKPRSDADNHVLIDSSRGGTKYLMSNRNDAELTQDPGITAFGTDGFSIGNWTNINENSQTYVAWNWKANGATPTKTYKVVVVSDSGNKYRFRNSTDTATFAQSAVTLDLQEGGTYTFDWSDSTAQGHPIRFSTTSDGTHGGGSEYTTGVVKDDSAYTTTITVASSAPQLYFYCQNHSGMGGSVNTNATFGSTNFDGSILSVSNPNTTSGLSIVTYTGTGSNATIGHGLGAVPKMIILKNRDSGNDWVIYNVNLGGAKIISLNTTDAETTATNVWQGATPTSSVFYVGTSTASNTTNDYVAYCFVDVEGFSKFGSYTGNGSNDGTFVYTGFRPARVMTKSYTNSVTKWVIVDNQRSPFNTNGIYLASDDVAGDGTGIEVDFLSNGFKWRQTGSWTNANNYGYFYMAFAENPFKYANAR